MPGLYDPPATGGLGGYAPTTGGLGAYQARPTGEMRNYEPTLKERYKYLLQDAMSAIGVERHRARQTASSFIDLSDWTPIGWLTAADEVQRNVDAGNYGEAAISALGAVPMVGRGARKAVLKAAKLISGQDYRDEQTIAAKLAAGDYDVFVSPPFEVDGVMYQVLMDGHHSFEAAKRAGVGPNIIIQTPSENDTIGLLNSGLTDDFLKANLVDRNSYVFAPSGHEVW